MIPSKDPPESRQLSANYFINVQFIKYISACFDAWQISTKVTYLDYLPYDVILILKIASAILYELVRSCK